ncbi:hypothetical protein Mapa_013602 [Marchantia paleacea]|nr:hypothetical protein Mapa_013602 [Marchantia paleacea]
MEIKPATTIIMPMLAAATTKMRMNLDLGAFSELGLELDRVENGEDGPVEGPAGFTGAGPGPSLTIDAGDSVASSFDLGAGEGSKNIFDAAGQGSTIKLGFP